jgi:hypothetical protein
MHASPKFSPELLQLRHLSFPYRLPEYYKPSSAVFPAAMREAQKVESLRLALATLLSILGCKAAEFDQSRLVGMQFQVKLRESFTKFCLKSLSIRMALESHHEIIGIPDDYYIAMGISPRSESIRETKEVDFVDGGQHFGNRPLDNLVLQYGNTYRSLSTVCFGYVYPLDRLRSVRPAYQTTG